MMKKLLLIFLILLNGGMCFATDCYSQLSPSDKTCTELVGKVIVTKSVDKAYNTTQMVTVLNVVPLQFQEKMLFSADYYNRVRQCIQDNGGNYCYLKYYNNDLPITGKGVHMARLFMLAIIFILVASAFIVWYFFGNI